MQDGVALTVCTCKTISPGKCGSKDSIDLIGLLNVLPNSNLTGSRIFVHCVCTLMWHSHLNDIEIPEAKRFTPKGFELGTTLSWSIRAKNF